jgi:anoctamin-10
MLPHVDLVIVFRLNGRSHSKEAVLQEARNAEDQYSRLLQVLHDAGLRAVGRKGEKAAHLLIFISCPLKRLAVLMRKERWAF